MRKQLRDTMVELASALAALAAPAAVVLTGAAAMAMVAPAAVLLAEPAPPAKATDAGVGPARRIEVAASRYQFEPARIEVQEGDTVEVVVHSADTDHGFAIKALGVKLVVPKGGRPVEARFVATQAGHFAIECSEYCGSGHKRMRGELVVTEKAR